MRAMSSKGMLLQGINKEKVAQVTNEESKLLSMKAETDFTVIL